MKRTFQLTILLTVFFIGCNKAPKEEITVTQNTSSKTIILAIDGGGIKGIIPATFLQAIEAKTSKQSYQLFDVIGGTSTGGIISVALTSPDQSTGNNLPYTADSIVNIYKNNGSSIFVPQNRDFHATYYADSSNIAGIEPYLQKILGNSTSLTDNYKYATNLKHSRVKQMFTTTYIVNSTGGVIQNPVLNTDYGPYLFNWYDANNSSNDDYNVWEAARGTSAAPTYFPIAHVGGNVSPRSAAAEKWVVDGGTMSNNPAVWGVTEAFRTKIANRLEDIIVVSLGTGVYPGSAGVGINNNEGLTVPADGDWSETPWAIDRLYDLEGNENDRGTIITVILDAVQMVSNSQLNALQSAGLQYFRLEPSLTESQAAMDNINPANIDSLITTANTYLTGEGATTFADIINELQHN